VDNVLVHVPFDEAARAEGIYERRKADSWKHPVIGHSLTYSRLLKLEARLLEKEWMGEGGLFARMRLR
jgi:CRISPR-associated protein Cas1